MRHAHTYNGVLCVEAEGGCGRRFNRVSAWQAHLDGGRCPEGPP